MVNQTKKYFGEEELKGRDIKEILEMMQLEE
jgi:hypothetical protein